MVKTTNPISNNTHLKTTLQHTLSANNFKRLQSHIAQVKQSINDEKYDKLKNDVLKKINAIVSNLGTTVNNTNVRKINTTVSNLDTTMNNTNVRKINAIVSRKKDMIRVLSILLRYLSNLLSSSNANDYINLLYYNTYMHKLHNILILLEEYHDRYNEYFYISTIAKYIFLHYVMTKKIQSNSIINTIKIIIIISFRLYLSDHYEVSETMLELLIRLYDSLKNIKYKTGIITINIDEKDKTELCSMYEIPDKMALDQFRKYCSLLTQDLKEFPKRVPNNGYTNGTFLLSNNNNNNNAFKQRYNITKSLLGGRHSYHQTNRNRTHTIRNKSINH
jgi:hypothetical protein